MPWKKTAAFKRGVIDAKGRRLKAPETTPEKRAYTVFHRLVFNLRRLMAKVPLGRTTLARYGAALWLIKEESGMPENELAEAFDACMNTDIKSQLREAFIVEDDKPRLGAKVKVLTDMNESVDAVIACNKPIGDIFGVSVYRAHDASSNVHYTFVNK
jgi:hypothetical protein